MTTREIAYGRGTVTGSTESGAEAEPKAFYAEMAASPAFKAPQRFDALQPEAADALLLPGGHAQGMRQYLDSELLQARVASFFASGRPISAICHGVLVAARAKDAATGKSVLFGRRTTCLPTYMERAA